MKWASGTMASVALALLPLCVGAQARKRIAVPPAIITQILADSVTYARMPRDRDSLAVDLVAEALELNGDQSPELEIQGRNSFCGANNCPRWIYRRSGVGYERLLAAGGVQQVEVDSAVHHGYRDVVTSAHESAADYFLTRYAFDGRRYRPVGCFDESYHYLDSQGNQHLLKRPRITPARCESDG